MYTNRLTVSTLLGQYLTLANKLGIVPNVDSATTINTKRSVLAATMPGDATLLGLHYFGIGIRGSGATTITLNDGDIPAMVPYTPSEKNMDLYHPIPVRMVEAGGLTPAEAANYRMKTSYTDVATGTLYDVYWLKCVAISGAQPVVFEKILDDVENTREAYVLDINNLVPTVPTGSEVIENLVVGTTLNCIIEGWELDEVITHYLDGRRELACVSEFGLYSGTDFEVNVDYTEAIGVQLAMHRCIRGHDASSPNAKITEAFIIESGNSLVTRTFD